MNALCGTLQSVGTDVLVSMPLVMHHCKGGCDLDPYEMITPIPEGEAVAKKQHQRHKYYVTPQPEQWPRYDASTKKFVHFSSGAEPDDYASMPSMLGLTKEEALSLSMVTILVDSSSHSGKYAETKGTPNLRKNSLVRGASLFQMHLIKLAC
jgi:hypothetical protein